MKRVTVFGAGRSGVAAANFLAAEGVHVAITDALPREALQHVEKLDDRVKTFFGGHPDDVVEGVDTIILSPGVPRSIPILAGAADRGVPVIAEIELAFRHLRGRVVAVTGSNGKSTTTALIGEILSVAGLEPIVAGNIGVPLIASVREDERIYVVELSSFQLESIEHFHANVAVLLNITPDHMDRYDSIDDYASAKLRIFNRQSVCDVAIVNGDDPRVSEPPTTAVVWRFSSSRPTTPGAWFAGANLEASTGADRGTIPRSELAVSGIANVENALAAWLAARAFGVEDRLVREAFRSFSGLPHRAEIVRTLTGVRWINDSKGTNVDATLKALEGSLDGRVVLVLGGRDKAGEFDRMRDAVARKAKAILTIGEAAKKIESALGDVADVVPCGDLAKAVETARGIAVDGDEVLLSPACASFDQYRNFEHRGEHFRELVRALPGGGEE